MTTTCRRRKKKRQESQDKEAEKIRQQCKLQHSTSFCGSSGDLNLLQSFKGGKENSKKPKRSSNTNLTFARC